MKFRLSSERLILFSYFIGIILLGSLLLMIPGAWKGSEPLGYMDALFSSTSAVCVTGLITVDTALYSRFGQSVLLLLIQAGGLGIITFATIYVAIPRKRISLVNRGIIKDYYIDEVDYNPRAIVRHILLTTFALEAIGAALLSIPFHGLAGAGFAAVFHSVSAFCNAGFSTFSTNLEGYVSDPIVNFTIMGLITAGGLGFMVLRDLGKRMTGRKRRLSSHSRVVIAVSLGLIATGAIVFYVVEADKAFVGLSRGGKIMASLFQSITPRTAGFDTISQARLSGSSVLVVLLLMFIGASPASTGGGIKTTTFFVLFLAAFRGVDTKGSLALGKRSISSLVILRALGIAGKAMAIVLLAVAALVAIEAEAIASGAIGLIELVFEAVSAFATVGLSLGITSSLADAAKLVLILTMFAGRVGLFAMALPGTNRRIEHFADLPEASLLVG